MRFYKPIAGDHAVDEAVVGVRLFEGASDAAYQAATGEAAQLADRLDLPGRIQLDPMSLIIGRQIVSGGYSELSVAPGMLYQRVNNDGSMAEELTVERTAVTYRTRSYRRWSDIEGYIEQILIPILNTLVAGDAGNIAVIELRCVDKFTAPLDPFPPLSDIVREGCEYVPSHLTGKSTFMHCHTGWFSDQGPAGRYLTNLSIDVTDDKQGNVIASVLQVLSKQSARRGNFFDRNDDLTQIVLSTFTELHASDKGLLASLLTNDAQSAINLSGKSGVGESRE